VKYIDMEYGHPDLRLWRRIVTWNGDLEMWLRQQLQHRHEA